MQKLSTIKIISPCLIDKVRWDNCIDESENGLIYGKSFYLDHMHADWCGIADKDYNWVLPVTSRKKWGISYLCQPPLTQQLGVFAKRGVQIPYTEIIRCLQKHYKFWEINWNYDTPVEGLDSQIIIKQGTNFTLNLSTDYSTLTARYHQDLIKNLKKSKKSNLTYLCSNDFKNCINLFQKQYGNRLSNINNQDYLNFKLLCDFLHKNKQLFCRQAANEDGQLMSSILLLLDNGRLYNLMNTTPEAGRKAGANHFLLDAVINEFAGTGFILDFEGSDVPGVRSFYQNFGAENQPFYMLRYNNLPWLIKALKD